MGCGNLVVILLPECISADKPSSLWRYLNMCLLVIQATHHIVFTSLVPVDPVVGYQGTLFLECQIIPCILNSYQS